MHIAYHHLAAPLPANASHPDSATLLSFHSIECFSALRQTHSKLQGVVSGLKRNWPRIWEWSKFFLAASPRATGFLGTLIRPKESDSASGPATIAGSILISLAKLAAEPTICVCMKETTGAVATITHIWISGKGIDDGVERGAILVLKELLEQLEPRCIADIIPNSGGTSSATATFCLRRISQYLPDKACSDVDQLKAFVSVEGNLVILTHCVLSSLPEKFLTQKLFPSICLVMANMANKRPHRVSDIMWRTLSNCFLHICRFSSLILKDSRLCTGVAVEASMLYSLLRFARLLQSTPVDVGMTEAVEVGCAEVLKSITVFLTCDSTLRVILRSVKSIAYKGTVLKMTPRGVLWDAWALFTKSVQERQDARNAFALRHPFSLRCGNSEVWGDYRVCSLRRSLRRLTVRKA